MTLCSKIASKCKNANLGLYLCVFCEKMFQQQKSLAEHLAIEYKVTAEQHAEMRVDRILESHI